MLRWSRTVKLGLKLNNGSRNVMEKQRNVDETSQIGNEKDEDEMDITTAGDELRKGKGRQQQLPPTARGGLSYVSI
ncbi:hypothetical protein E6C27_scaffold89G00980 [Cucumis melo var. makuwa]|uniref:Uncharacterized protein n=1 Tax=Cucumis melo var. makuwa TaxID=1194695 RepID=A0A5A7V3K2_CUCMM|nr:hypothetical protein E6C27_scaffold89G00980 [Cucumis melo var. makuwa]